MAAEGPFFALRNMGTQQRLTNGKEEARFEREGAVGTGTSRWTEEGWGRRKEREGRVAVWSPF